MRRMRTAALLILTAAAAPLCAEDLLGSARQHDFARRNRQAVEAYRAVVQARPGFFEAWEGMIRCLIRDKRAGEAYRAWDEASRQPGTDAFRKTAEGHILFRQAEFDKADAAYVEAIRLDSRAALAYVGLASLHGLISQNESAANVANLAYRLMPQNPTAILARAYELEDPDAHIAALEQALALFDPSSEEARALRIHVASDRQIGNRDARVLESPYTAAELRLEQLDPRNDTRYALTVLLNNRKKVRMLLDTGASGVSLKSSVVKSAGLEQLAQEGSEVKGVGDKRAPLSFSYLVESLAIGPVRFRDYVVSVSDRQGGMDGIVGADVFSQFLVTLDFPARRLLLAPYPGLEGPPSRTKAINGERRAGTHRVFRKGNHLFLPVTVNQKASRLFLIDSGAFTNLISADFAREQTKLSHNEGVKIHGVQGEVDKVFNASRVELTFAGLRQNNSGMLAFDFTKLSNEFGFEIGGIIGMPILERLRLTIDYRNGAVEMRYRDK